MMGRDAYSIDEYTQLEAIIRNGGDRIPICFCIDVSPSMDFLTNPSDELEYIGRTGRTDQTSVNYVNVKEGYTAQTRIMELKRVLKKMIREMKNSPILREAAIIDVVVFGKFADFVIGPVSCHNLSEFTIDQIKVDTIDGGTQTALGINLALEKIDFLTEKIEEASSASYLPVFILMSDGAPSDGEASVVAAEKLRKRSEEKKLNVIPVAIGAGATPWMRSLSEAKKVYRMDYSPDFDKVFQSITTKIWRMTEVLPFDAMNAGDTRVEEDVSSSAYGSQISDEDALKLFDLY